jgi:hypothetical protein
VFGLAQLPGGRPARPDPDPDLIRPAILSHLLSGCKPVAAAYTASIADLAATGYLRVSPGPGGPSVSVPAGPADPAGLPRYLRRVLASSTALITATGTAPFAALDDACRADPEAVWQPFEQDVRTQARRLGLARPLVAASGRNALLVLAVTVAVAVIPFGLGPGALGPGYRPVVAAIAGVLILWTLLRLLARDRLTATGVVVRARWQARVPGLLSLPAWSDLSPDGLRRQACAFAAGQPAGPQAAGKAARRAPTPRSRPAGNWSPMTGSWRLVPTGPSEGIGLTGGVMLLAVGGWFGLMGMVMTIAGAPWPTRLILLLIALGFAVAGIARLGVLTARPASATFDGMVIARWEEEHSDENSSSLVPCVSVDDGSRAWTFTGRAVHSQVSLGDRVRVTINPRSNALRELTVRQQARPPETELPSEPGTPEAARSAAVLTEAELTGLLGPEVRTTLLPAPGGGTVLYSGRSASLSVVVTQGGAATLNLRHARRSGRPLAGIGDEAWLTGRGRVVVLRVGDQVAKLIVSGRRGSLAPAAPLNIAAALAARLAGQRAPAG